MKFFVLAALGAGVLVGFSACGGADGPKVTGLAGAGGGSSNGSISGGMPSTQSGGRSASGSPTGGSPQNPSGGVSDNSGGASAQGGAVNMTGGANTGGAFASGGSLASGGAAGLVNSGGSSAVPGDPGNTANCPATEPPNASVCMRVMGNRANTCGYGLQRCTCSTQTLLWVCAPVQVMCPVLQPNNGGACVGVGSCSYVAGTTNTACACTNGAWACGANASCPGTAPANTSACVGLGGVRCGYLLANAGTGGAAGASGIAGAAGAGAMSGAAGAGNPAGGAAGAATSTETCRCGRMNPIWTCL